MTYTRRLRTLAASVASFAVVAFAATPVAAQNPRVTIDFAEFRSEITTEYQATPGGEVNSRGYHFYANQAAGARNALGTWGTNDGELSLNVPRNLGPRAAAMWGTAFGERIDMVREDGQFWNLHSIDVAHMYDQRILLSGNLEPITLFFYGFQNNSANNTLAASFTIPAPALVGGFQVPNLLTLAFSPAWTSLNRVVWFQGSGALGATTGSAFSHQFTNVVASIVPEPGTYALLATGLAGVLVVARRRRTA
jgi:hypothetical protein